MNKNKIRIQKHLRDMKESYLTNEIITYRNRRGIIKTKGARHYFKKQMELTKKLLKTC